MDFGFSLLTVRFLLPASAVSIKRPVLHSRLCASAFSRIIPDNP
jgi:hypothetical protein